jgi:hypothetical protein
LAAFSEAMLSVVSLYRKTSKVSDQLVISMFRVGLWRFRKIGMFLTPQQLPIENRYFPLMEAGISLQIFTVITTEKKALPYQPKSILQLSLPYIHCR